MKLAQAIIETKNLSIGYVSKEKRICVQKNLNLQLRKGEFCCLIGPNGVGKSTLLRTLSRQINLLDGEIFIQKMALNSISNPILATKLSLVLTEKIQIPNLKVRELVEMGRFPYSGFWGNLSPDDNQKVDEAIQLVGIQELEQRNFDELSDGEKQKALIAKALAQDAPLILLDEPTAYLDFPSKMSILSALRRIAHTKQIGIILSTHDLELALKMADLIWLVPANEKVQVGIPEDLVLNGSIGKTFSDEYLHFDMETAHFLHKAIARDFLNVEGNSMEMAWFRRALLRKGIAAETEIQMPYKVSFDEENKLFVVNHQSEPVGQFQEIHEVLSWIETILNIESEHIR
ncbi:MAG TPA: iron ABC transporter ATP-binding protein [Bacteroidales bacterium]|nr:iron ABC transporter ATP-binding protein [Bacteroidales bacterium]